MNFSNYRVNLLLRLILITLTVFLLANLYFNYPGTIIQIVVFLLLVFQVILLYNYLNRTNKEITQFLNSIKYDDFSYTYPVTETGSPLDALYREFNKVLAKMREIRAEKDEQYYYLKNIVKHLGIGIITFDKDGKVQIINTTAKRLLNVKELKDIKALESISPTLVESFFTLKTGGSDLIKIVQNGDIVQLSIYAIELTLRKEAFKLISIQNIQSELEEKEMEAWQNLIRVLTHEIMNSVTPISSLAATVDGELLNYIKDNSGICHIDNEDMKDIHLAVQTIQKRSEGLIRFVSDFRNLTRIPVPKLKHVKVHDIFNRLRTLLKQELKEHQINLRISIEPESLTINADQELIEQVLINLVKNAIQALGEEEGERVIELSAYIEGKRRVFIKVKDNGSGIEEDALGKIFIPFFTTKKTGSGIGLSLSKQIMRQHKGTINVRSNNNEGTEFLLKF